MMLKMPAEWAPHEAVWIGFPHLAEEWAGTIDEGRRDVAAFANAVHDGGRGEEVRLVVNDQRQAEIAAKLVDSGVKILVQPLGDIWLRDTGPIFGPGSASAQAFVFNGWGGKYDLPHDDEVADQIGEQTGVALTRHDFILEGGALDHDGAGTILTTRQCLLNPNRNTGWTEAKAEAARLAAAPRHRSWTLLF